MYQLLLLVFLGPEIIRRGIANYWLGLADINRFDAAIRLISVCLSHNRFESIKLPPDPNGEMLQNMCMTGITFLDALDSTTERKYFYDEILCCLRSVSLLCCGYKPVPSTDRRGLFNSQTKLHGRTSPPSGPTLGRPTSTVRVTS